MNKPELNSLWLPKETTDGVTVVASPETSTSQGKKETECVSTVQNIFMCK